MARRRRIKLPPEPVECKITGFSHDGKGIAYIDDKTVFIDGALMGETVRFTYTGKRKQVMEGVVEEVLQASPDRVEPKCEFFAICGGCSLQHLSHDKQLVVKQQLLIDNLKRLGHVEAEEVLAPLTGPIWGYRRKARLGVRYVIKKQKLLVGFREKRSNFLTEMTSCQVLHPSVGLRLVKLGEVIFQLSCYMQIPQIEVAIGDDIASLVIRHLEPLTEEDKKLLSAFALQYNFNLYLQSAGPDSIELLSPVEEKLKALSYQLPEYQVEHQFKVNDFTQVNMIINRQMINLALSLLDLKAEHRVLDLFCGLGNFTLPLARNSAHVTGVEGSDELVVRAKQNALENSIDNADFYSSDLFINSGKKDFRASNWAKKKYDRILLDPARSGAKEIVEYLPYFGAKIVVYVSCNPATLARDADIMVNQHGYKLVKTGIMDMFPHTAHVESIALFIK
ncbi:MAG: 23S rRNA (uracil(1939)-C(5))-methyltransferase RlmD [Pseudomonadota bacterium]